MCIDRFFYDLLVQCHACDICLSRHQKKKNEKNGARQPQFFLAVEKFPQSSGAHRDDSFLSLNLFHHRISATCALTARLNVFVSCRRVLEQKTQSLELKLSDRPDGSLCGCMYVCVKELEAVHGNWRISVRTGWSDRCVIISKERALLMQFTH